MGVEIPYKLELINYFKTSSIKIENKIHKYYSYCNIFNEWFNLREDDINNILSEEFRLLEFGDDYFEIC